MWNIWNRCLTRHRHTTAHWTRHFPPPPPPPPPSPLALLPPQISSTRASFLSLTQCWVSPLPLLFRQRDDDNEKTEHEKYTPGGYTLSRKKNKQRRLMPTHIRTKGITDEWRSPARDFWRGQNTRVYLFMLSTYLVHFGSRSRNSMTVPLWQNDGVRFALKLVQMLRSDTRDTLVFVNVVRSCSSFQKTKIFPTRKVTRNKWWDGSTYNNDITFVTIIFSYETL